VRLAVGADNGSCSVYLKHAAACPACSGQLRIAVELIRDQMTEDESFVLGKLAISREERAQQLAERMTLRAKSAFRH
jgi:hypothetical protein